MNDGKQGVEFDELKGMYFDALRKRVDDVHSGSTDPEGPCQRIQAALSSLAESPVHVSTRAYAKGEYVCRQGDKTPDLLWVNKGMVRTFLLSRSGQELNIDLWRNGGFINAAGFLVDQAATCYAEAFSDRVEVYAISRTGFQALRKSEPEFVDWLLACLSDHVLALTTRMGFLHFHDLHTRIEILLLTSMRLFGQASEDGTVVDIRLTHEDIAAIVGASRAKVSEYMSQLKRQGFFVTKGEKRVISPSFLDRFSS
jgi:CRP-like cAMP-binding protein